MPSASLVITLGDPLSVNAEAIAHTLQKFGSALDGIQLRVIGSRFQFHDQLCRLGFSEEDFSAAFEFVDCGGPEIPAELMTSLQRGTVAMRALQLVPPIHAGPLAVLTCPIDKAACHAAGFSYPGQTEFFADLWDGSGLMTLVGKRLVVGLVSNHVALRQVSEHVTGEAIVGKATILGRYLRARLARAPKLAVCGLNPHCGDGGMFGFEDVEVIAPAVRQLRASGLDAHGPLAADTVFHHAAGGQFDGVLAMYHDQGLAPFKTLHFHDGVNMTLGLGYLRLSPDHGPAADKFLTGTASFVSFECCLEHALAYLRTREVDLRHGSS